MIDAETLCFTLLTRDKPEGVLVGANVDMDSINSFPFITYDVTLIGQNANGRGLYSAYLDLNVLTDDVDGFSISSDLYDAVHAWDDENTGIVPGIGWVSAVRDQSAFSDVSTPVIPGRLVNQYSGSFALQLRNI